MRMTRRWAAEFYARFCASNTVARPHTQSLQASWVTSRSVQVGAVSPCSSRPSRAMASDLDAVCRSEAGARIRLKPLCGIRNVLLEARRIWQQQWQLEAF